LDKATDVLTERETLEALRFYALAGHRQPIGAEEVVTPGRAAAVEQVPADPG
jgi:hypothetical protein